MKRILFFIAITLTFASCKNDKTEDTETETLVFKTKTYSKKTALPCKAELCAEVNISVPEASNVAVVADSINKKVFNTVRSIVYFGEKPYTGKTYEEIMNSFIASYDKIRNEYPDERPGWEAKIEANVDYTSENILNIKLNNYTYTGGAHGYQGIRSLIFDKKTGKSLEKNDFLKDTVNFKILAENKFREKYKIPATKPINSTGLMFIKDVFELPQTFFFTNKGLLLYYNTYEIASYVEGPKELLIPYSELEKHLVIK